MTSIAYTKGVLAADSKLSGSDGGHWADVKKIKKVKGWLIGAAGDWDLTEAFMSRFDPKIIEEKRHFPLTNGSPAAGSCLEALIISPKGKVYYLEESGMYGLIKTHGYIAIGCGEPVAMGAMATGATAVEAVRAAIRHNGGCGGRIQSVKLRS